VTDASEGVVPAAELELTAIGTGIVRHAKTEGHGDFSFADLPIGTYRLRVSCTGFATTQVDTVIVHASQVTPVNVALKIGSASDTVTVSSEATPLLDASSNSLGSVIDLKAIEVLPLVGRDLTALARLTPGYAGEQDTSGNQVGVWNGQPLTNQGVNVDGVVGAPSRGKYNGNVQASASPRIENIEEMSIQTDQIDLDQGFGRSSMQLSFVTRSGTNQFHGRAYIDSRNSGLFANTYANNASGNERAKVIYNDFGGSVGGPILRDKLFFFGSFSTRRLPQDQTNSNYYLTSAAQTGDFTYTGTDGATHTVNLFDLAHSYSPSLPTTVNADVSSELSAINSSLTSGSTISTSDPNIGSIYWNTAAPYIYYYPTVRTITSPTSCA
jgi:hypothetical protein